jgi:TonB family protein
MEELMAEAYRTFASHILFKEVLADELGHLYRAAEFNRTGLQRTVWLRVFDGEQVPARDLLDRLEIAGRVARKLQAGNVAANAKFVAEGGTPAMAWDFVPAQPLSAVLRKVHEEGFPVPVDNALLILEKLSLALTAGLAVEIDGSSLAHGCVHPALVQVTNDGEGLVTGFGVADQLLGMLDSPEAAAALTPYLAPEVLMTRTASLRGDVYSLGAILYHLLTGAPLPAKPEERSGLVDGAELAFDDEPIPADIKALLGRALAARPEERFSSAADFKKELDKLLYGGAYSPTTFNLALFMDRLFRSEIDTEERERAAEAAIDVMAYLAQPTPEPEPAEEEVAPVRPAARGGKGLLIGAVAAVVVVVGVGLALLLGRSGPEAPPPPPTPTPEEAAAQREAEETRIREAVERQLQTMLAQREEEIRAELSARQDKISELEKQLAAEKNKQSQGSSDAEAQRRAAEIERQLEAERKAQEEQERKIREEQEAERQRLLDEARRRAAAQREAQAAVQPTAAPAAVPTPEPAEPEPTRVVQAAAPSPAPAPTEKPAAAITENSYVDPSDVDSLPSVLKDQPVVWPRMALHSRRRGVIIVQAMVNAEGKVDDVKVLRADTDGFGIPQAAMDAVRKYQFKPATKDGVKVKTTATVTIPYAFRTR